MGTKPAHVEFSKCECTEGKFVRLRLSNELELIFMSTVLLASVASLSWYLPAHLGPNLVAAQFPHSASEVSEPEPNTIIRWSPPVPMRSNVLPRLSRSAGRLRLLRHVRDPLREADLMVARLAQTDNSKVRAADAAERGDGITQIVQPSAPANPQTGQSSKPTAPTDPCTADCQVRNAFDLGRKTSSADQSISAPDAVSAGSAKRDNSQLNEPSAPTAGL